MKRKSDKAQSFIEYAILIILVIGVLLAMRTYMTRAVQEKYRQSGDVFGAGEQYEKGVTITTNEQ
jgi:hypothetical protein